MKLQLHNDIHHFHKRMAAEYGRSVFSSSFICIYARRSYFARYNPVPNSLSVFVSRSLFGKMKSLPPIESMPLHAENNSAHSISFCFKSFKSLAQKICSRCKSNGMNKRTKNCNWNIRMNRFIVSKIVDSVRSNVFPYQIISSQISLWMYRAFFPLQTEIGK